MKRLQKRLLQMFLVLLAFGLTTQMAQAKKFGSGGSFGYQKQMAPKQYGTKNTASKPAQQPNNAAQPASAASAQGAQTAAKSGASKWLGPLAGLAAGGLLAAMLFGDGFENFAFMDFLLIALIAFAAFMLFKKMRAKNVQNSAQNHQAWSGAYAEGAGHSPSRAETGQPESVQMRETLQHEAYNPHAGGSLIGSGLSEAALQVPEQPSWFDAEGFLANAKEHYVAVQKAWDASDVNEIRDYCSPELFAAIGAEMAGMKPGENYTEVESLDAEIAAMAIDGDYFIVSVRFSGFIKEARDEDAHSFSEIWHIRRLASDSGDWQIAGIQEED